MTLCREYSLVKHEGQILTARPLLCKCWSCEYCRPIRYAWLRRDARSGNPNLFVTLTSRVRNDISPDQAARNLVKAWRKVKAAARRKYPQEKFEYLAVFEETKQGWPHLHILTRGKWLDQSWLSAQMDRLTDSPIVDVRRIRSKGAVAAYVAKYVSKASAAFKGCKRYFLSRGYLSPARRSRLRNQSERERGSVVPSSLSAIRSQHPWAAILLYEPGKILRVDLSYLDAVPASRGPRDPRERWRGVCGGAPSLGRHARAECFA